MYAAVASLFFVSSMKLLFGSTCLDDDYKAHRSSLTHVLPAGQLGLVAITKPGLAGLTTKDLGTVLYVHECDSDMNETH